MPYSKPLEDIAYPHEPQIVRAALSILGRDPRALRRRERGHARRRARGRQGCAGAVQEAMPGGRASERRADDRRRHAAPVRHDGGGHRSCAGSSTTGSTSRRGEELVEIETDKANMTYESDREGTLQTVAGEGDTLAVGELIARIGEARGGKAPQRSVEQDRATAPEQAGARSGRGPAGRPSAAQPATAVVTPNGSPEEQNTPVRRERVKASPLARRIARDSGSRAGHTHRQRAGRAHRQGRRGVGAGDIACPRGARDTRNTRDGRSIADRPARAGGGGPRRRKGRDDRHRALTHAAARSHGAWPSRRPRSPTSR